MDPYTATPDTVTPLPFHGMRSYPPTGPDLEKSRALESTMPRADRVEKATFERRND